MSTVCRDSWQSGHLFSWLVLYVAFHGSCVADPRRGLLGNEASFIGCNARHRLLDRRMDGKESVGVEL